MTRDHCTREERMRPSPEARELLREEMRELSPPAHVRLWRRVEPWVFAGVAIGALFLLYLLTKDPAWPSR